MTRVRQYYNVMPMSLKGNALILPRAQRDIFLVVRAFYRWQKLLNDSDARKQRLLKMQEQFRQIEELFLTFAKRASAFNSWFENAEEDLTDPVRCNSIEEIRALREAHAQFQVLFCVT